MTISKGRPGPDPAMTVSNIKPPDLVEFNLYWSEDWQPLIGRRDEDNGGRVRACFSLGDTDRIPRVTVYRVRAIGRKGKVSFRVDLVHNVGDGELPPMTEEERVRFGRVLAKHLTEKTGLRVDPIKSGLFDYG
jgi:hypothetical protein